MLVLTRRRNQRVRIGDAIEVRVLETHKDKVKLGFTGPPEVTIHREEVYQQIHRQEVYERSSTKSTAAGGSLAQCEQ
jgi:carbon storage regulator